MARLRRSGRLPFTGMPHRDVGNAHASDTLRDLGRQASPPATDSSSTVCSSPSSGAPNCVQISPNSPTPSMPPSAAVSLPTKSAQPVVARETLYELRRLMTGASRIVGVIELQRELLALVGLIHPHHCCPAPP